MSPSSTEEDVKILSNGLRMPLIGLGTLDSNGDDSKEAVKVAIDSGYRHFDTACFYRNEKEIGEALKSKIGDGSVRREDLFITNKLWNTYHRPDLVRPAIMKSLDNLQLDYIDVFIMHWPLAYKEDGDTLLPRNEESHEIIESNVDFVDTWAAMVPLIDEGLCRGLGISNFNEKQIDRLLEASNHRPIVMQFECHPYLTQQPLSDYCKSHKIAVIAYSPLGTPNRPNAFTGEPNLFADTVILGIAKRLNRSQAQIMIRYQVQRGHATIPKSVTATRIISNIQVFDFELSAEDMVALSGLNFERRFNPLLPCIDFKEYPFEH